MPFALHCLQIARRVPLVRGAQLMVADGFVVGDFRPLGCADVVLRVDKGVADEANVGHDADELFGRHGGPDVPVDLGVVDLWSVSELNVSSLCLGDWTGGAANHEGWREYGS